MARAFSGIPSTAQKALQTFGARVIVTAAGILTGILIARTLGPAGKGAYSAVQMLLAFPLALSGGAGAAITYLITRERWAARDLLPALAVLFGVTSLLCAAGAVAYGFAQGWSFETAAFALAVPAAIVTSWQPSYYIAVGRLRTLNTQLAMLAAAILGCVFLACVVLKLGVPGALGSWLLCTYVCAGAVVFDVLREAGRPSAGGLIGRLRVLTGFASKSALNTGLGLLNYRIDSIVLAALLGLSSFGIYSIAVNFGEMLFLLIRPINMAVSREIGSADLRRSGELTAYTVRFGVTIALVCAAIAFAAGPFLIHALYGGRFDGAALPLRLLLPGIVAFAGAGTFASFLTFQLGRPLLVAAVNAGMIAAQVAACLVLVPRYGMAGAAAASTLTYFLGAAVNTMLFCRSTGVHPAVLWIPRPRDMLRIKDALLAMLPRRVSTAPATGRIVLTGAAGGVAAMIRPLLGAAYDLTLTDRRKVRDARADERFVRADLRNLRAMRRIVRGSRAIVHLGGISTEAPFETILQSNIRGLRTLLEAARLEGVRRVVFASTGHVTGFYSRQEYLDESAPVRPDTLYAVSKSFGEALGRYYADKFGMEIVCIRIGHVCERPQLRVDRHIWLSPPDLVRLLKIAIEREAVHYEIVYGVSDNADRWWSIDRARALGYEPADRALAAETDAPERTDVGERVQGESFAARGFTGSISKVLRERVE